MEPTQDKYPIFEANQVLSNSALNQSFDYLDEQERLTRANLIGIGIVCGLEIRLETTGDAAKVHLSKGCGVTSAGYLIVEPADVVLTSYREYKPPVDPDYPAFKDESAEPYPLWEMFPEGEPDTTPLATPANFLSEKAVLLFYELKQEGLRTCSPNDCNDRGSEVTATVRRLLISRTDLNKIIAAANALPADSTSADLEKALLARLNLPDLRLPRYDVPNTDPVTTNEVLTAFQGVFFTNHLAQTTGNTLTAAYQAFKPILQKTYPSDPFAGFKTNFGFLDKAPKTTAQVRFLQYYYDFFDDLLRAYDEFLRKGVDLLCACCPPEGLFPRHLMLGLLAPDAAANPTIYRHYFRASPAIAGGACTKELEQLFRRLVEMTLGFTQTPSLPAPAAGSKIDRQIRITPSTLGAAPLSAKAIPYYYRQNGEPPLYRIWNYEKSRQFRANQNLSYQADKYTPAAPAFVTDPLRYDLEPHNFLRIEGHLGKNYLGVLETLLFYKTHYRLPIEVIALRTGAFDENMPVDLSKETCRFQDLEALYDALREELLSSLGEGAMYFYNIPIPNSKLAGGTPGLPLLRKYAPNFRFAENTVGAWCEKHLPILQSTPYIDVDQNKIDSNAVLTVYCLLFYGVSDLPSDYFPHVVAIYYLAKLAEVLPSSLDALGYADFANKYQDLMGLIRFFRSEAVNKISEEFKQFIPQEDLIDHFDQVLFACKLESFKAIHEEYVRRIREVKQKQFLSFFLRRNPGIQHKAGVPLGGTFIIAYHEEPVLLKQDLDVEEIKKSLTPATSLAFSKAQIDKAEVSKAFKRISAKKEYALDPDINYLLSAFTGQIQERGKVAQPIEAAKEIIKAAVDELADGTVIADFFLPYLCCSDCAPVQFVLPVPPLGLEIQLGCTGPNGTAEATLTPKGGMAPYTYQLDKQPFKELTGKVVLTVGPHTLVIRDSAGAESASQSLTVLDPLIIWGEKYTDEVAAQTYTVSFNIAGGTRPYIYDSNTLPADTSTTPPVESGKPIKVEVTDSAGCKTSKEFQHTVPAPCELPCEGKARRCGYRFWLPESDREKRKLFRSYKAKAPLFRFEFPQHNAVDLAKNVEKIIQASIDDLNNNFNLVVNSWVERINKLIAKATGSKDWLRLEYLKEPSDFVGTLWIEYFECLDFEFQIQSVFQFEGQETPELFNIVYTAVGTKIQISDSESVKIPAFDCKQIYKCDPERPIIEVCKEVDLKLPITKERGENNSWTLDVTPSGPEEPVAFLWEVQDGIPALSNNKKENFIFKVMEPPTKIVRLTAYTKTGCRATGVEEIKLR